VSRAGASWSAAQPTVDVLGKAGRHRGHRVVHLGFGEGALVGPEGQPPGEALLGLGQRSPTVDIEQFERAKAVAGMTTNGGGDGGCRPALGDDDRKIALDRRVTRRRRAAGVGQAARSEAGDRELGDDQAIGPQVELRDGRGMELSEPPGEGGTGPDPRTPPGMEVGIVRQWLVDGSGRPRCRQSSSTSPLASSRSYGRA
jgi:hypothetical protein